MIHKKAGLFSSKPATLVNMDRHLTGINTRNPVDMGRVARMSGSQGGAPHVGFTCGAFDFDLEFFGVRSSTSNSYDFLPFVNPQNRSIPILPPLFRKIRNCSTPTRPAFPRDPVSPDWCACTRSSLGSSSRYTR
jgi:hypothetical protein